MVILGLALLALAVEGAILPAPPNRLASRQIGSNPRPSLASSLAKGTEKKPTSVKEIPAQLDKSAIRKIIRWGPYTVGTSKDKRKGFGVDPESDSFVGLLDGLPKDAMILSGELYPTLADGRKANIADGIYTHHVQLMDMNKPSKQPFSCDFVSSTPSKGMSGGGHAHGGESSTPPTKLPPVIEMLEKLEKNMPESWKNAIRNPQAMPQSQLFGSGDDGLPIIYGSKDPSLKAGYYLSPESRVYHFSEFINYSNKSREIYITSEVEYVPGKAPGFRDSMMGTVSALGCGIAYLPPQNEKHVAVSPPYNVTSPGTLYNLRGHLHDGGINVRLHINNKLVCESKAIYGGDQGTAVVGGQKWETIQDYTHCPKAIDLKVGDQLVVDSEYDLRAHKLRPSTMNHNMGGEAMGLMSFAWATGPPK